MSLLSRLPFLSRPKGPDTSRAVEIGWFLDTDKATFIWDAPQRLKRDDPPPAHAKAVNYCPSVLDHEARMFEVLCPIDARLRLQMDEKGEPKLINVDGDQATVRGKHLGQMLALVNRREWRHPKRPILQIITPYVFLADEQVFMAQIPPIGAYNPEPWPGQLVGGRLPINIWPRQMMWAFEWYDTSKDIVLKRGQPWFYVRFETHDPSRPIRMFEAEVTPQLREYMQGLSAVSNYVNRTYSLFKVAKDRRPEKLLQQKKR